VYKEYEISVMGSSTQQMVWQDRMLTEWSCLTPEWE